MLDEARMDNSDGPAIHDGGSIVRLPWMESRCHRDALSRRMSL